VDVIRHEHQRLQRAVAACERPTQQEQETPVLVWVGEQPPSVVRAKDNVMGLTGYDDSACAWCVACGLIGRWARLFA
jgi:hypothetical protein